MGINNLRINEDAFYKLRRRKIALGEKKGEITGFPSIDMPWLKYYSEEQITAPVPQMSAYDYLRILNSNNLSITAIEFLGQKISYLELFKKINDASKALYNLGVKPGEVVTIMLPACPEEVYLFYALDKIGAVANFVFPGTPLNEIQKSMNSLKSSKLFILEDILLQPNDFVGNENYKVITYSLFNKNGLNAKNIVSWDAFWEEKENCDLPLYNRNQDEPLFIAKTGGSTGKPKCVVLSDRSFNVQVHQHLNASQNYEVGDRWLRLWPLFSASAAVSSSHLPLCAGMTLVIEPVYDVNKIDEVILRCKPSHMPMITSGMDALINSPLIAKADLSFLKSIGVGGEIVTPEFEAKANEFLASKNIEPFVRVGYGMTENGSGAAARFNQDSYEFGSIGIPQVNTVIGIFDPDTLEEKKYNQDGEICILSSSFMLGYYNDEEKTKTVIREHKDGRLWLHSGDLGSMNEDGKIFVKGRIKRVISLFSSDKVFPLEIESLVEMIDGIEKAIVVPEHDKEHPGFFTPCCFVVTEKDYTEDELLTMINDECLKDLPQHCRISRVHIRKMLPHTDIGKVDLKELECEALTLSKKI